MATCVRAPCPLDLNAAPCAVRVVFFASVRRGTTGPGKWIVAVCHQGGSIVSCGGFAGVWICFFFLFPRKKIVVRRQVVICELLYALNREVLINAQYLACTPDGIDSDSIEMSTCLFHLGGVYCIIYARDCGGTCLSRSEM